MSTTPEKMNNSANKITIVAVIAIYTALTILGSIFIASGSTFDEGVVYKVVAFDIIMVWLCVFTAYFIWALHFYNINFGVTNSEWEKIYHEKEKRRNGNEYNIHDINDEPKENPYKKDTFGLPTGTVRGMIAFTLLFGAIAILIASLAPENNLSKESFLFDQFEFFKTAFLMMIAFYFGSRSLEYLRGKNQDNEIPEGWENRFMKNTKRTSAEHVNVETEKDSPKVSVNVEGNVKTIPMITAIKDPMDF